MQNLVNIKALLDQKYLEYNQFDFIADDPVSIPHQFSQKEDIEIAAFLSATIAWGNRKSIIKNANKLMNWMDNSPYQFIVNFESHDLQPFKKFVHRTFNGVDCCYFLKSLQNIYKNNESLETAFKANNNTKNVGENIVNFRNMFFSFSMNIEEQRTQKHVSNPAKNSSAKRLCMFLRWMVRKDKNGVDFGIWNSIKPSQLCCPLDVHTSNVGRQLDLLNRKQNDWKAVVELTDNLRKMDADDPVKYDFALFGLGVNNVL